MRLGLRASVAPRSPVALWPAAEFIFQSRAIVMVCLAIVLFGLRHGHQPFLVDVPWRFLHQLQYLGLMDSPIGKSISSHQIG